MIYNKQYFIDKFSAIPDKKWTRYRFVTPDGRACALGLCGCDVQTPNTIEGNALLNLFLSKQLSVAAINDGYKTKYQQSTPKQRILAALNDLPD